jgi:hypothetical protein
MRRAIAILLAFAGIAGAEDDVEALKARIAELEARVAELSKQAVPYRVLKDAENQSLYRQGRFEDAAFELLQATPDERQALIKAVGHAEQRLAEILQRSLPPISGSAKLSFAFGPLPDEGIEAELLDTVRKTLGDARADFFDAKIADFIRGDLMRFGRSKMSYTITRTKGQGGDVQFGYEVKEEYENGSSSGSGSYDLALPGDLRLLKPYIPRAFLGDAPDSP